MPKNKRKNAPHGVQTCVRTFGVYAHSTRDVITGEQPLCFITKEVKDQWERDGAIRSVNRGRDVRLKLNLPPRPQLSQTMGQNLIEGCWGRKGFALAIAEAWKTNLPIVQACAA